MKKILALLLALVIFAGCLSVTAYTSGNMTDELQAKLSLMNEGDTERIILRVSSPELPVDEIDALAYERAGFSDEKKPYYGEDYGAIKVMSLVIKYEYKEAEARRVADALGIPDDRLIEISGLVITADLTKEEITAAANMTEVESITYDIDAKVSEKVSPALRETMAAASEGDTANIVICFDEKLKTIDEMPSWPDGKAAMHELTYYVEKHNLMLAVDLLGPDYIDKIMALHKVFGTPWTVFAYYYYLSFDLGRVSAYSVPVQDIPRIASDSRVKRIEAPGETRACDDIEPDNYTTVMIDLNNTYGRISNQTRKEEIEQIQELYFVEIFADTEPVIIYDIKDFLGLTVVAAVKPGDIEKIASRPSVSRVEYFSDPIVRPEIPSTPSSLYNSSSCLYEFDEEYGYSKAEYPDYKELCAHRDSSGMVDWILFKCSNASMTYTMAEYLDIIGNRVFKSGHSVYPFACGYGIYDVKAEKFVPLTGDTASDYPELSRIFDQIGEGRLIGDLDGDNDLNAVDCTIMQRCATLVRDWPENDEFIIGDPDDVRYFSDFDRDGERDIVDATRLQRYVTMID